MSARVPKTRFARYAHWIATETIHPPEDVAEREREQTLHDEDVGCGEGRVLLKDAHHDAHVGGPEPGIEEAGEDEEVDARPAGQEADEKQQHAADVGEVETAVVPDPVDDGAGDETRDGEDELQKGSKSGDFLQRSKCRMSTRYSVAQLFVPFSTPSIMPMVAAHSQHIGVESVVHQE